MTTVTFDTRNCEGTKYIILKEDPDNPNDPVDAVRLQTGDTITFTNELDGNSPVQIEFFTAGEVKTNPIAGFCTEASGTALPVPDNGSATCTLAKSAETYAYKVSKSAGGVAHEPLDPVIIIEPEYAPMDKRPPDGPGTPYMAILGALIVGLVLGFFVRGMFGPGRRA